MDVAANPNIRRHDTETNKNKIVSSVSRFFHVFRLETHLKNAIVAPTVRSNRKANPPVIKPIRVFVSHPSWDVLLLCLSIGSIPPSGGNDFVEMPYSVLSDSMEENDEEVDDVSGG